MQWCWAKLWLLRAVVVCIPGRCPVSPHFMLMTMPGSCIQSAPAPQSPEHNKDVSAVAGDCGRGDGEAGGGAGHSLVSVWPECGHRGPGTRGPRPGQCPMYGPDPGLSCGAVVVMLSGH